MLRRGEEYDDEAIAKRIGMPCFVKPAADGSSFGVSKVKESDQLAPALRLAFMESEEAMVEAYMQGVEISQGIYKTKDKCVVLPATEVVTTNEFFDYDAKYNGQVRKLHQPVSHPRLQKRWQRPLRAFTTFCMPTESSASTTSSPRTRTARMWSICWRSIPLQV